MGKAAAAEGSLTGITPEGDTLRVREVWEDNLEDEMQVCSEILAQRSYWVLHFACGTLGLQSEPSLKASLCLDCSSYET